MLHTVNKYMFVLAVIVTTFSCQPVYSMAEDLESQVRTAQSIRDSFKYCGRNINGRDRECGRPGNCTDHDSEDYRESIDNFTKLNKLLTERNKKRTEKKKK